MRVAKLRTRREYLRHREHILKWRFRGTSWQSHQGPKSTTRGNCGHDQGNVIDPGLSISSREMEPET